MTSLRRVLCPLAMLWLICQAAAVTVALPAFRMESMSTDEVVCTCAHGGDGTCPMHHKKSAGSRLCTMHSADESGTLVLRSLLSVAGLIPTRTAATAPDSMGTQPSMAFSAAADRPVPPDPPPPRA
jgi:hypothetical protein